MSWNPTQYLAFADHRLRPVVDLLNRVPTQDVELVVDLGCGAGNATKFLRAAWPKAEIIGVDSSPEMLQRARDEDPGVDWVEADIATWQPPRPVSVLFSNAALHWLDGHEALIPKLAGHVEPGGCLALQMPANFRAPSHTTIEDIADQGPWRDAIVPLNTKYPIAELLDACRAYPGTHNARRITFEYVMLGGVNDGPEDARGLVALLKDIPAKVNLIPFNAWPGAPYECSRPEDIAAFADFLNAAGLSAPVRTPRGRDILAACGQLKSASQRLKKTERAALEETAEALGPA